LAIVTVKFLFHHSGVLTAAGRLKGTHKAGYHLPYNKNKQQSALIFRNPPE
jgi:hypothetical protein